MPPVSGSVPGCFLDARDQRKDACVQLYRSPTGWQYISGQEMVRRVAGLARAFGELGIQSGDRVGLFAPNCPEWHVADLAIQGLGAITVPFYFRESPERITYILKDSGTRTVFAVGEEQGRKIQEIRKVVPSLEHVISTVGPPDLQ